MPTPTSTQESRVDVLIIGAGPSGLMCANALVRAGVNVRIVDKRPEKVMAGQADGLQPRMTEILQSYGLAERLFKEGNQMHMAVFYNPSKDGGIKPTKRIPEISTRTARYPFDITIHQGVIESIFLDSMQSYGLQVERPVAPVEMEVSEDRSAVEDPEAYPVKMTLKRLDAAGGSDRATEIVHAKFVLGGDGAHSWVRKSLGITMEGERTDYIWGVIDFVPETDFPDIRKRCLIHSDSRSCMVIPRERDMVRLYIQLSDPSIISIMDNGSGRLDKSKVGPLELLAAANKSMHPYSFKEPKEFDWWTLYIIGQRVASTFTAHERVFIAGDACHTHSPKAGLGMNASMNDTHNLAWKLAYVLRGWAPMSLLKTYEFERRKFAEELIDFDKKFSALFSGKPLSELNMDGIAPDELNEAFQRFGDFTSGIGIHYDPSSIVDTTGQKYAKQITIGERMPPKILVRAADCRPIQLHDLLVSDTKFKILAFLGSPERQMEVINDLSPGLSGLLNDLAMCMPEETRDWKKMVDVISILQEKKTDVKYNAVPEVFRVHWSKVFVDDVDVPETQGGDAYDSFGIDGDIGAVVVVRPDGFVGMISSLETAVDALKSYFCSFLRIV